jgi:DNA-binding response OmpR family regulator
MSLDEHLPPASEPATILIVDDEPFGRDMLAALLQPEGYQLRFAANGPQALAQAATYAPDLILLDVMMPGMDGFEVCRRLRADPLLREAPVMMLTALDDRVSRLRAIEAGADDFISKPFDRVELRARVRTIARLNRYRRLLAERAKFARAIELAPDGVLIVDSSEAIVLANPAMLRLLGAPEEARLHLATALTLVTADFDKARLTEEMARAEMAVGGAADAAVRAEQAQGLYTAAGADVDAWRVQALWAEAEIAAGNGQVVVEPLAAAYALVEKRADAAPVAAQLALQCARGYYVSYGDAETSIPWFDRAVQLAEALEDLPQLSSTLASYAGAFVLVGRPRMGLGLLRVSLELARELDDPVIQLKPLNNLVSFLATRDLHAAIPYAEEGLAVVRRLRDREWGLSLGGSVMHVYWTSGRWDEALELHAELGEGLELNSLLLVMKTYATLISACRGEPVERLASTPSVHGTRSDVMLDLFEAFLDAAAARATGDLSHAAELTRTAAIRWATLTGIDDDFSTFWLTGIDDALAVSDVAGAEELLALVTARPHGHITPYLRCQLARVRATINAAAGKHESVERDFVAAGKALRDFGAIYWLGRTLLEHAEWLTARGREIQAPALAAEAARIFEDLHATPWFERATAITSAQPILVDDHT